MSTTWEYKTLTLKHSGGLISFSEKPGDDESTAALNREGSLGWELVSAVGLGAVGPITFYFKRPR